ncbi:hypothetical protein BC567DRAFT_45806 [Phyllosticta citribraziliensis]
MSCLLYSKASGYEAISISSTMQLQPARCNVDAWLHIQSYHIAGVASSQPHYPKSSRMKAPWQKQERKEIDKPSSASSAAKPKCCIFRKMPPSRYRACSAHYGVKNGPISRTSGYDGSHAAPLLVLLGRDARLGSLALPPSNGPFCLVLDPRPLA